MGIHGDDIVRAIRKGLADENVAPQQTEARWTPIEDGRSFPNRDGRWEFDVIGRDWFRGFRITVEAIDTDAAIGELGNAIEPDGSFRVQEDLHGEGNSDAV